MNIPKGYKLVPVEPTVAMEDAAAPECGGYCSRCDTDMQIKTGMQVDIYRAMLDSAPTPPQPIYDESTERELFEAEFPVPGGLVFDQDRNQYYGAPTYWLQQAQWEAWQKCAQSRAKTVEARHE